jgi:hypothetical protein
MVIEYKLTAGDYTCSLAAILPGKTDQVTVRSDLVGCPQNHGGDCNNPRDQGIDPCPVWYSSFRSHPDNKGKDATLERSRLRVELDVD